jgi:predicted dehydrogenase
MTKARLAVAGLGRMGRVHAGNVARACPSAELVSLFDPRADVAKELAGELGARAAASYEELLDDPGVDAVVIASPTSCHADLALQAARAGKPAFSEKPLSLEREASERVIKEFAAAGLGLQVGFHRRFDPALGAVAAKLRAGELGEVFLFRSTQRDKAPPPPEFLAGSGGIFVDMGIHDFDTARWLLGEVASVSAHGEAFSSPEYEGTGDHHTVVAVLEFESGALGVADVSRLAGYGYESSIELMGEKATVRVEDPYSVRYTWLAPGSAGRPLVQSFVQRFGEAFALELEAFARSVVAGRPPEPSGLDALAAFDIATAAAESCRLGRPVEVAPPAAPR